MDWSILVDCFYNFYSDELPTFDDVSKDEHIANYIEELKNFLKEEDKDKIDHFTTAIINHIDLTNYKLFKKAIHFGVQFGMEIQQMIHDYYDAE